MDTFQSEWRGESRAALVFLYPYFSLWFFYGLTLYDFQKRHRQSVNSHSEQLKKICSIYRSPCCGHFRFFPLLKFISKQIPANPPLYVCRRRLSTLIFQLKSKLVYATMNTEEIAQNRAGPPYTRLARPAKTTGRFFFRPSALPR